MLEFSISIGINYIYHPIYTHEIHISYLYDMGCRTTTIGFLENTHGITNNTLALFPVLGLRRQQYLMIGDKLSKPCGFDDGVH